MESVMPNSTGMVWFVNEQGKRGSKGCFSRVKLITIAASKREDRLEFVW